MNNLINADKHDSDNKKVKKFSPYRETISLYVTKRDCELRRTGECPIFTKKGTGHCTELLKELEKSGFTQMEGRFPDVIHNIENNYYMVNGGQHRICIASILKMDIMINKNVSKGDGDIRDTSSIIVEKGVPRINPFCNDPY